MAGRAQRQGVFQPKPFGQLLIDSGRRAVVGGMRTVDCNTSTDEIEQHAAFGVIGADALHRPKKDRVMAHDQRDRLGDRFGNDRRRHAQAGHHPLHFAFAVAEQQADVVPLLGQMQRRELFEKGGDVLDTRRLHCVISCVIQVTSG
jgi:hypothetical protein